MVEAVLTTLDVPRVTALGHSFGADVAVELAERSARVERLVIVTQAPDYTDATLPRGRAVMTVPVLNVVLHRSAQRLAGVVGAAMRGRTGSGELAARAVRDLRALNTAMFRIVLVDRRDRMAARPLDAQVRAAGKPTLVILGERDHFYGARSAHRYRAAGARVEVLPDSGHSPLLEHPGPTAALIRSFAEQN
jgi:pimeloyl-ACP methyl ester carboxylesterase